MLANQVKNAGILRSLISLNNLVEEEIKIILSDFPINHLEYSILMYISNEVLTQYKISKEYNISVQRINQLMNNLEKHELVTKREIKINGRLSKEMITTSKCKKVIKEINSEVIKKIETKGMESDLFNLLNQNLKNFLDDLRKKV